MCGIAGFMLASPEWSSERLTAVAEGMARCLRSRGPDDAGTWVDDAAGVAFGHRRLAIVDLTSAGRQPMVSSGGRWVLVYNGELYNTADIRKELEAAGDTFRGHSDTELLLTAIERYGVRSAIEKANGMFAFAAWDRREHQLWLGRDRVGEKPLYYGWADRTFLFGSELKALRNHPAFNADVDRLSLREYVSYANVPAPRSIYRGIFKLPAGCFMTVPVGAPAGTAVLTSYWSVRQAATDGVAARHDLSVEELESLLLDAVRRRMVADVPLGALLSGGIDSSVVVAMMQAVSSRPVRTFTIGFAEAGFDEAPHAQAVAKHLDTEHTELYVTAADAQSVIPRLPSIYDEPFADSSQIPTLLVCELARRSVTVALSGDGGDEVFGGYARHQWAEPFWRRSRVLPPAVRRGAAYAMARFGPEWWPRAGAVIGRVSPGARLADPRLLERIRKATFMAGATTTEDAYQRLISVWAPASNPVLSADGEDVASVRSVSLPTFTEEIMCRDMAGYLPDDILTKVDRASMSVSLEVRAPFLDHRLIEEAWRLPLQRKVAGGIGKLPLRELLHRHLPPHLFERPKSGFALPLGTWLRGPLRGWAEDLLGHRRLRDEGFFDPVQVRGEWDAHLAGRGSRHSEVWTILMFQAWLEAERARS